MVPLHLLLFGSTVSMLKRFRACLVLINILLEKCKYERAIVDANIYECGCALMHKPN